MYIGKKIVSKYPKRIFNRLFRQPMSLNYSKTFVKNKEGVEIGGPSNIFSPDGIYSIYSYAKNIDNINYSPNTIWNENNVLSTMFENRYYNHEFILDATNLDGISNESYDFVINSHVLEHLANPIKALFEWKRILKKDGHIITIIPHKDGTFDHLRPLTKFSHIIDDYKQNTKENDPSHFEEVLKLHDLKQDRECGTFEHFKSRTLNNNKNRAVHHHVFNTPLAIDIFDYVKMQIVSAEAVLPFHIIIVAQKTNIVDNSSIYDKINQNQIKSPFESDFIKGK